MARQYTSNVISKKQCHYTNKKYENNAVRDGSVFQPDC